MYITNMLDRASQLKPAWNHKSTLQINVPAPVGMICAGLFLANVPNSGPNQAILIWGLKGSWSREIRAAALAIIFLRSGLEIDLAVRVFQHALMHRLSASRRQRQAHDAFVQELPVPWARITCVLPSFELMATLTDAALCAARSSSASG